jgi:two-component system aerobic respiration control protein ArcA
MMVVTSKIPARTREVGKVATKIPSEKGKFMGWAAKYGFIKKKINVMPKKKINAQDLIARIEKLTKARMATGEVVQLDNFRELKKKIDPKTILVIEDDETMRAAMKKIFEMDGFTVKLAADGSELATLLDSVTPDLILLDIGLPWLNGYELGQLLKEHRDLKKIPLVFVSGKTSDEDIRRAFEIGADDFVKKPFEIEKLKKTVNTLLKISK